MPSREAATQNLVRVLTDLSRTYALPALEQAPSEAALKARYRQLCLKVHPDKGGDAEICKTLNAAWAAFTEASASAPPDEPSFWDDHSSGDEADGEQQRSKQRDSQSRTQLITFSHSLIAGRKSPKDFTRTSFKDAVVAAYAVALPHVSLEYCCVFRELHKRTGKWQAVAEEDLVHFHLVLKADKPHRWKAVADALRLALLFCHFSLKSAGYDIGVRYGFTPSKKKQREELDEAPEFFSLSKPHPDLETLLGRKFVGRMQSAGQRTFSEPPPKKMKLSPKLLCHQLVVEKGYTKAVELMEYATDQFSRNRNGVYLEFLHGKPVQDFINAVHEFEHAKYQVRRDAIGRMGILRNLHEGGECLCFPGKCVCKCVCGGKWYTAAAEVLAFNDIDPKKFCGDVLYSVEHGACKAGNVFVWGETNRAKSFLFEPLERLLNCFHLPQFSDKSSMCPLAGLLRKEMLSWQDFRLSKAFLKFVAISEFLLFLEGKRFNVSMPKTFNKEDEEFRALIPLFFTGPKKLSLEDNPSDQDMLDIRFIYYHFTHYFPKTKEGIAPCCAKCWVRFFFDAVAGKLSAPPPAPSPAGQRENARMSKWSVEEVLEFLSTSGFAELSEVFRENEIDGEVLVSITERDLRGMGIQKLGVLKKLLKAIEAAL